MQGITACILKIDFNYKLASKIRIWTKQGQSFSPYKCLITIHNEDGLTVFWKALKNSESFCEIEDDLIPLRQCLDRNAAIVKEQDEDNIAGRTLAEVVAADIESAVKVIYVDNCCQVHKVLKKLFPGALIKLDPFHWLKWWNDCLKKPMSAQGGISRSLMSQALFHVEPSEYKRATKKVKRKKKPDHQFV